VGDRRRRRRKKEEERKNKHENNKKIPAGLSLLCTWFLLVSELIHHQTLTSDFTDLESRARLQNCTEMCECVYLGLKTSSHSCSCLSFPQTLWGPK
jgi:hypothetical protein